MTIELSNNDIEMLKKALTYFQICTNGCNSPILLRDRLKTEAWMTSFEQRIGIKNGQAHARLDPKEVDKAIARFKKRNPELAKHHADML